MPFVDGVRISESRHSDSKVQYIGKIVCVAGNEIDREASTTHSGMLASSFKKKGLDQKTNHQNFMKTETRLRRSSFDWSHSNTRSIICAGEQMQKNWNVQFNSNNKIVKERIWIAENWKIQNRVAKVDVEPNARSRTYSKSSRLHVRMFKKSEHEQEALNESSMYDRELLV